MRFSIVVPVYGVEKYLEECVQSLFAQTFKDFEIILVDDRSPDRCPEMCDEIAKRDDRVRVIHKPQNEGLGFARNTGLEAAKGDYILFVDSDDTIDRETLEECAEALEDDPDIVVWGMRLCYENKKGKTVRTEKIEPEDFYAASKAEMAEMFRRLSASRVFQYACNKAYRREFVQGLTTRFEKTKLIEDFLFNIEVFGKAERVRSIDEDLYFYRKPTHVTLASSYNPEFFKLAKRKFSLEEDFLREHNAYEGECLQQILKGYIKHYISAVVRNRSKVAHLSQKEQNRLAKEMLLDETTQRVLQGFEPKGFVFKTLTKLMKKQRVKSIVLLCSTVNFAQQTLLPLVKKLKG